jgi:hypothetical protein
MQDQPRLRTSMLNTIQHKGGLKGEIRYAHAVFNNCHQRSDHVWKLVKLCPLFIPLEQKYFIV